MSGTPRETVLGFVFVVLAAALDAGFPWGFTARPLPAWSGRAPAGWSLELDTSVPRAFLDALPGGVTPQEEAAVAALPANTQLLAHRNALGYLPEPRPDAAAIAQLMVRVGADTPLARIWCWFNPWNGFGYADLVLQADAYRREPDELLPTRTWRRPPPATPAWTSCTRC